MIFSLFRRNRENPHTERIYAAIVAQSRHPDFYTDYDVPDTIEGRYDLLILHAFLVIRRLSELGEHQVSQHVCDKLFAELERALREDGVGDLSVPKRMKKMAKIFYGRVEAYEIALLKNDESGLADALNRNILRHSSIDETVLRLTRYVFVAFNRLADLSAADLFSMQTVFPEPGEVV